MALISTQALPVKQVIFTSSGSGKLTFILNTPYLASLFLGTIVLTRVTSGPAISGTIIRGTDATHGGKALLYVDATTFDSAHGQVLPFKIVLGYDDVTFDVVQLDFIHDVAHASQASVDAVLEAVQALLPPPTASAAASRDGKQQPQKGSGATS
jgi:hypothetical protein